MRLETRYLRELRTNRSQILIATDVKATGRRSFMHETVDIFGTGIMQDCFQIVGID